MARHLVPVFSWLAGIAVAQQSLPAPAAGAVDYPSQIAPLLAEHCGRCHGAERQRNGLRLDRRAAILKGGRQGPAAVVGDSTQSLLVRKVAGMADGKVMPPEGALMTAAQLGLLRAWIDQGMAMPGADGPDDGTHWSYRAVRLPALPPVDDAAWCQQPLDRFVLHRLQREGLRPSPAAPRATWLRRVALDLCGLPPTPAEVAAFLADTAPDAYERQVDRLLALPSYGEQRAWRWLDLARYADSMGYEKDGLRRTMWRWRDQLIASWNEDVPFDRFTQEQLAGDLLRAATLEQQVATAFHRQTMNNTEGGTDNEEFRCAAVVDRVNTTMSVWMGSTMACAQCHDHKYDPFTQVEYYRLFAFFDQTEDADRDDEAPTLPAPTAAQQARAMAIAGERAAAVAELRADDAAVQAWAEAQRRVLSAFDAAAPVASTWQVLGPLAAADFDAAYATVWAPERGVTNDRLQEGLSWRPAPEFVDGRVHTWRGDNSAWYLYRTIASGAAASAVLSLGSDDAIKVWWNGKEVLAKKVGRAAGADQELLPVELTPGINTLLLKIVNGGGPGGFYFDLRRSTMPPELVATLMLPPDACDEAQRQQVRDAFRQTAPDLAPVRAKIAALDAELAALAGPAVPVMRELPADRRRTTRVHVRGSFLTQGEVVTPDVPSCWPPLGDRPRNRLGLAQWLCAPENPLTARVQVNRVWEELFGRGLVETVEDFGAQGDPPMHPELLDWLAAGFMTDWSMKRLLRTIVLSATYRQSSVVLPELLARDPYNRLLARAPALRLSGEALRDQALAVSGLLRERIGGPSVMPHQPDGVWLQMYSGDRWQTSPGDDRWRRSMYTFWRRTSPHPMLMVFDAPSREVCKTLRVRTNTPLQALASWNDPQFVEAAVALAARALREPGDDLPRLEAAFVRCLLRAPTERERDRLLLLVRDERRHFAANPAAATALVGPWTELAGPPPIELATFTVLANVLLSLDEFVTRG
ncbi:MAG: PSD1 domain-containing protein [Planctomycetes bacterium]|nr:PSD1 domain-containing protein [Planctomycetota bacterium]